ncbi:zinc-binding dehydrogenase [Xenorhabdus littoralis]|nr:zinc-binding dehydrogenase [Xenorhabdus sp. psl]
MLHNLISYVEEGKLYPVLSEHRFILDMAIEAHDLVEQSSAQRKVVIDIV